LTAFRAQHAKAAGRLAGKEGNYADILQTLVNESHPPRPAEETNAWPTFAADAGRSSSVSGGARRLQRICAQLPQWRFSLEHHVRLEADPPAKPTDKPLTPSARNRAMAFHPVIVGDHVLVADARSIVAYSLTTGEASVWFEKDAPENLLSHKLPALADLGYTLTVAEDRVLARLGVQDFIPERDHRENLSSLVCLNLKPGDNEKRPRWQVAPDEPSRGAVFEGAPVVKDGRVLIAATRVEAGQTITAIQCYPAHAERTPQVIWRRDVCSTTELHGNVRRLRHYLLTVAGSLVVYASHSGAIIALDAQTGWQVWAVRYPSQGGATIPADGSDAAGWKRDLAPCVHAAGRLYVAPADYDRVLCLDPATGSVLWERGELKIVHLLGVAQDRLIFTLPQGIRAVDAATGADVWQMPDLGTSLTPVGRGFIADDLVFWPTSMGLKVLQVDDGQQSSRFAPDPLAARFPADGLGNMVYANGCLAIAGMEKLDIYLGAAYQRAEREADVRAYPHSAKARYRLAMCEMDAGALYLAAENLRRAEQLAGTEQATLAIQARATRQELLQEIVAQAAARRDSDRAAAELDQDASSEFPAASRAQALTRLAELWTQAGQPARAVAAWQRVLDESDLHSARVEDRNGNPQQAATLATAAIDRLIQAHGPTVYAASEERARTLVDGKGVERVGTLRRLTAQFPNAAVTNGARWELAQMEEKAGRIGAASRDYRTFLRRSPDAPDAPIALVALGHIYDRGRLWSLALSTWREIASRFGTLKIPAIDAKETVGFNATWHIHSMMEYNLVGVDFPHTVQLPLLRAWEETLEPDEKMLAPGDPPTRALADEFLFFSAPTKTGGRLTCRETATGKVCWAATVPFVASWLGCSGDSVVVGGAGGVANLCMADGESLWSYPASDPLDAFRLLGQRLLFLEGGRRLLALDAETGEVLWSRWAPAARLGLRPPSGRFNPNYYAGQDRVLIQTSGGRCLMLDANSGKTIQDVVMSLHQWPRSPVGLANDRYFGLATESNQAVILDTGGKLKSKYELSAQSSLTGQLPQLVASPAAIEFLLIPRNYGTTLLPLYTARSTPGGGERLLTAAPLTTEEVSLYSRDVFYFAADNVVTAHRLKDRTALWTFPLPEPQGRWRVMRAGSTLIVWPLDCPRGEHLNSFPVFLLDAETGQVMQRVNMTLTTAKSDARTLPVVHLSAKGLTVAAPGIACRFLPAPK
jgi:outer membrane protein assembly factor BamB/tetratricopeptide (TPR) repeat protein